ncbi:GNAT family N-acetyltransferase [Sporolactobacillus sp. THM7-4]|nr:GNAT family N-acetyltransferase [Sporolactobacillus sp. THM7-4]
MPLRYLPITRNDVKEMVKLWNQEIGDDFPMREELLIQNSFLDPNVRSEGSLLAMDDQGCLIGFVIAKKYSEPLDVGMNRSIGWIQVLLVRRDQRNQGIGTVLLNRAEKALTQEGASKIFLGKDVWHYFPGIPDGYESVKKWFVSRNYHYDGTEYDLLTETVVDKLPEPDDGARFSLVHGKEDERLLLAFLHRNFPGRWEYEAIKYFERGGDGQEFVILKKNGKVIGFCRINGPFSPQIAQNVYWSPLFSDGQLGGMGPLGIDATERGNGYGSDLVRAGIACLNGRGLKRIVIDWTRLIEFYRKVGARPWKAYATYSKQLNEPLGNVQLP